MLRVCLNLDLDLDHSSSHGGHRAQVLPNATSNQRFQTLDFDSALQKNSIWAAHAENKQKVTNFGIKVTNETKKKQACKLIT